jgi:hypothetical protein
LPKHYYTSIPDYAWLRQNRSLWQRPASLAGFPWDLDRQLRWLEEICKPYYAEVKGFRPDTIGPGFGFIEAQILHCFIRKLAPARVIEVGAGTSTAVMARAARINATERTQASQITTIDPFPAPQLLSLPDVDVRRDYIQAIPKRIFEELRPGDLLSIDSSHAVKTGSDVLYLYLEVIPILASGVYIHIHDIFLPYLYRPTALHEYFDWQETALLLALLIGNDGLDLVCCESALHHARPDRLAAIVTDYLPKRTDQGLAHPDAPGHFPSSTWLVRTGGQLSRIEHSAV